MTSAAPPSISRSTRVAAPARQVWDIVSDLPRMGELSPEATGGRWAGGATGPASGSRFRGTNRNGGRRWSTLSRVVACEPGRRFAFDVSSVGLPVARWSYDLVAGEDGCTLTETWTDRRGRLMTLLGGLVTGVGDREAFTGQSIEHTLERVKARAEGGR